MNRGSALWAGTEESFFDFKALESKYLAMEPMARDFEEDEIHPTFGVRADRKGLEIMERVGGVNVLKVHGSLVAKHSWWHGYTNGAVTSYEAIIDALDIAARDENKTPLLMDVGSPGGSVRGLDPVTQKISWAKQFITINAHTDTYAMSAGYWIGSAADRMTASRMAELGAIGTLVISYSAHRRHKEEGDDYKVFRAGEFKALGNPYEELSEKAAKYIQENLDKANGFFLDHVSRHRGLPLSDSRSWAEGKVFFADDAKRVGLIDQVVTLDDLLRGSTSQTSTSDRRYEMNISQEKLAQIAAGAVPGEVLSAEELKAYNEGLEAEAEETEAVDVTEEGTEASAEEVVAETEQAPTADLMKLMKEVGGLEVKLEASMAEVESLKEKLKAKDTDVEALAEVAQVAIGNLCIALDKPKAVPVSAAAITSTFTELQAEMSRRFKVGKQSAQAPTKEGSESKIVSFRHNV